MDIILLTFRSVSDSSRYASKPPAEEEVVNNNPAGNKYAVDMYIRVLNGMNIDYKVVRFQ